MKLLILAAVLCLATPAFFQSSSLIDRGQDTYPLWHDTLYDNPQASVNSIACSTGGYGMIGYGYKIFSDLPTYPAIGGIPMIDGWDSPNCGTCWQLTYTDVRGNSLSTFFTAINIGDQKSDGFTTSLETVNYLMNGNAEIFDGNTIHVAQMLGSYCGL